jgi:UDPglucose 6-dehydrogenase
MSYSFINIVGYGYVGSSLGFVCKQNEVAFSVTDLTEKQETQAVRVLNNVSDTVAFSESVNDVNFYFVCVPTPSKPSGECNTDIVTGVIESIKKCATKQTIVCVKSTIQPRTCRKLQETFGSEKLTVVFLPEFLTERRAHLDMYEAKFALIGTSDGTPIEVVSQLFRELYKHNSELEIITKKYEVCELFKYTINCFLATKVWYFNEIYELSEKLGFEYNELKDLLRLDPRVGSSHIHVPGPDGKFSFNLTCFPKDCDALRYTQHIEGLSDAGMSAIIKRANELREKPILKKE